MNLVSLSLVRTRVISLLMANGNSPYSGAVGTGSNLNSRYQSTQEFTDTILEVDAAICAARISNPADPFRQVFMAWQAGLANGAELPGFVGVIGEIQVDIADPPASSYEPARLFNSRSEAIEVINNPALYPSAANWAFFEGHTIFHNGTQARVRYPSFTKSSACQAPEIDELAEVCGTIAMLVKDGAVTPELYGTYGDYFNAYLAMLRGDRVTLPDIITTEKAVA